MKQLVYVNDCKEILMRTDSRFKEIMNHYYLTKDMSDEDYLYCSTLVKQKNEQITEFFNSYHEEDW